jgi:hypothetical protein
MKTLRLGVVVVAAIASMALNSAKADQPHMQRALEHLRAAREELRTAEHNKGGWRVRALNHVERAISDTEAGMHAGR